MSTSSTAPPPPVPALRPGSFPARAAAAPRTLAEAIAPHGIGFETLDLHYRPMLRLVRELTGVVPSCDPVLEIWPTAFRSYNLLVPALLNLPPSLFGLGAPKDLVGLAMYTSSRAAECAYCSAHCCSYALRRGAAAHSITGERDALEAAVVRVAEGLGSLPHDLAAQDVTRLRDVLPDRHVGRVVAAIALMGFLNKFDSLGTYSRVLRQAPGAIRLERAWTPGVPSDPKCSTP